MSGLKHGPRFSGGSVVSTTYTYDPEMDSANWGPAPFGPAKSGSTAASLRAAKGQGATRQSKARVGMPTFSFSESKTASVKEVREAAEAAMLDRLLVIVQSLQFGLSELQECQAPGGAYNRLVNQKQIAELIVFIKSKCLSRRIRSSTFDHDSSEEPHE